MPKISSKKRTWSLKEMITKKDKFLMDVENQIMRKEGSTEMKPFKL